MLKRLLFGLLSTLVSVILCLVVLEFGVRLIDGVPLFRFENYVAKAFDRVRQPGISRYDAKYGWAQEANIATSPPAPSMTTGELGIRMPSTKVRPLPQGAVLTTGDSLTVGSEVADDGSWPAQLEGMIGAPVNNAGNGGYSVDQTVMRTEEFAQKLNPSSVIVEIMGITSMYNALKVYGGAPKPYYTIENGKLVLHNQPVPRIPEGTSSLGLLRNTLGYSYLMQFVMTRLDKLQWWIAAPQRYQWQGTPEDGLKISCLLMQRLAALRDERKIPVAVLMQYGGTEIVDEKLPWDRQMLINCVRAQNLQLVDSYAPLQAIYKSGGEEAFKKLYVMHNNGRSYGHMSVEGNRLIAKLLAEEMFNKKVD